MNVKGELLDRGRDRVRDRTTRGVNARIDEDVRRRVELLADAPAEAIGRRLAELDREWDVDRALMAQFAIAGGLSFILGVRPALRHGRWTGWLSVLSAQLAFVLSHAVTGWCPSVLVYRRLGFRTQKEIAAERRELEMALLDRPEAPQVS
jgi:hypothetical protein